MRRAVGALAFVVLLLTGCLLPDAGYPERRLKDLGDWTTDDQPAWGPDAGGYEFVKRSSEPPAPSSR